MDMHSGGNNKEKKWKYIYIEAPEDEAKLIFYNRFGHDPERVSCTCCGEDYSISEEDTFERASAYDRNCTYDKIIKDYNLSSAEQTVGDYEAMEIILVIRGTEIKTKERQGTIPKQGYVWMG